MGACGGGNCPIEVRFVQVRLPGHDFTVKKGDAYYECRYSRMDGAVEVRRMMSDEAWQSIGTIPSRLAFSSETATPVIEKWVRR